MPVKGGKLTPQEREFSKKLAQYGDPTIAAEKAGYSNPAAVARQKMQVPAIRAEAERLARNIIQEQIIPKALGRMVSDLSKASTSTKDVVAIFKAVAGYGFTEKAPTETELHEKTAADLDALIAAAERRLAVLQSVDAIELEAEPGEPAGGVFD